jgi:hypothetical protein
MDSASALFLHGRNRLRAMRWSNVFYSVIYIVLIALVIGAGAEPGSLRERIRPLAKGIAMALVLARLLSSPYTGGQRLHAARAGGAAWHLQILALLPTVLLMWVRADRANLSALFAWLLRRPQPVPPAGRAFGFLVRSNYSTVFCIVLIALLVELPMDGLIASVISKTPHERMWIGIVLSSLAIYSLLWLLGDRRQLLCGYQVVDAHALQLAVGARLSARIPLAAIEDATLMAESISSWCKQHDVPVDTTLLATPVDRANVMLRLAEGTGLCVCYWHVERPAPRYLFLFADDPAQLVHALTTVEARS